MSPSSRSRVLVLGAGLIACAGFPPAFAVEIQTSTDTVTGTILQEDGDSFYIESKRGIENIQKSKIIRLDGKEYALPKPKKVEAPAPPPAPPPAEALAPPAAEAKTPAYLGYTPPADRDLQGTPAPNVGVQFGTVEQLQAGIPPPAAAVKERPMDEVEIHPAGVTEKQLKEYYGAHPDEFVEPAQVHVRSIGQAYFTQSELERQSSPAAGGGWQDGGWIRENQAVEPFSAGALAPLFSVEEGKVSPLIQDTFGAGYYFLIVEKKQARTIPYDEARPKILSKILRG